MFFSIEQAGICGEGQRCLRVRPSKGCSQWFLSLCCIASGLEKSLPSNIFSHWLLFIYRYTGQQTEIYFSERMYVQPTSHHFTFCLLYHRMPRLTTAYRTQIIRMNRNLCTVIVIAIKVYIPHKKISLCCFLSVSCCTKNVTFN